MRLLSQSGRYSDLAQLVRANVVPADSPAVAFALVAAADLAQVDAEQPYLDLSTLTPEAALADLGRGPKQSAVVARIPTSLPRPSAPHSWPLVLLR